MRWGEPTKVTSVYVPLERRRSWSWWRCKPLLLAMYAVAVAISAMMWAWACGALTEEMIKAGLGR